MEEKQLISGIYKWVVPREGKSDLVYIGQSDNLERRKNAYLYKFGWKKSGRNVNRRLTNAVNKYGLESVEYFVVELCDVDSLDQREIFWFNYYVELLGRDNVLNFMAPTCNYFRMLNKDPVWKARLVEILKEVQSGVYYFINPEGMCVEVTRLNDFCRDSGLSYMSMFRVAKGEQRHHRGWTRDPEFYKCDSYNPIDDYYRIASPDGVLYLTDNFSAFCREFGLNGSSFRAVYVGICKSSTGWSKAKDGVEYATQIIKRYFY